MTFWETSLEIENHHLQQVNCSLIGGFSTFSLVPSIHRLRTVSDSPIIKPGGFWFFNDDGKEIMFAFLGNRIIQLGDDVESHPCLIATFLRIEVLYFSKSYLNDR